VPLEKGEFCGGGNSKALTWVLRIVGESMVKLRFSAGFDLFGGGCDVWRDNLGRLEVTGLAGGMTEIIVSGFWSCGFDVGCGSCDVCIVEVEVFKQGCFGWWWRREGRISMAKVAWLGLKERHMYFK